MTELYTTFAEIYDAEVVRRQRYLLQTMAEKLLELRIGLRQVLALKERRLRLINVNDKIERLFKVANLDQILMPDEE